MHASYPPAQLQREERAPPLELVIAVRAPITEAVLIIIIAPIAEWIRLRGRLGAKVVVEVHATDLATPTTLQLRRDTP